MNNLKQIKQWVEDSSDELREMSGSHVALALLELIDTLEEPEPSEESAYNNFVKDEFCDICSVPFSDCKC